MALGAVQAQAGHRSIESTRGFDAADLKVHDVRPGARCPDRPAARLWQ